MKKLSKKSILLFGAVLAVCAFAVPSMASAGSWAPLNTTHVLDSINLSFTAPGTAVGAFGGSCAESQFHADVRSAAILTITTATFRNCSGTGAAAGCTETPVGTGFHWNATGISTTNIQIHNVDIDLRFETRPPAGSVACAATGQDVRVTGTLLGGANVNGGIGTIFTNNNHEIHLTNAVGLISHSAFLGTNALTVNGTIRDTSNTLVVNP